MTDTNENSTLSRRYHFYLFVVFWIALIVRVLAVIDVYGIQALTVGEASGGDSGSYIAMATGIFTMHTLADPLFLPRQIGFPLALAGVWSITGISLGAGIILNIVCNLIACLFIMRMTWTITVSSPTLVNRSATTTFIAGLLAALHPAMITASAHFMSESVFLAFFTVGIWLLLQFMFGKRGITVLLLGAGALACAALTRSILLLLPFVCAPFIIHVLWTRTRRVVLVTFVLMAFLALSALLPNAILTFRNAYYGGIPTVATSTGWIALFMRATSSERRVTHDEPLEIYRRYIQEIEKRLGNPVPPDDAITPDTIWNYYVPTPEQYRVINQLALERNAAYPQWYILNSAQGLINILFASDRTWNLPAQIVFYAAFYLFTALGIVQLWRTRQYAVIGILAGNAVLMIAVNIALQTALLNTRHGLSSWVLLFPLAGVGAIACIDVFRRSITSDARDRFRDLYGRGLSRP